MLLRPCPSRVPLPRALAVAGGLMLAAPFLASAEAPAGESVEPRAQASAIATYTPSTSRRLHVVVVAIERRGPDAR